MIARLAFRNLLRNRWRTGLTAGGIAVAVALLIWTMAYIQGFSVQMARGATAAEMGQIQIHTPAYLDEPSLRNAFKPRDGLMQGLATVEGVAGVSPRLEAYGLLGTEARSQVARLVGVRPEEEQKTTEVVRGLVEGHWLGDPLKATADPSGHGPPTPDPAANHEVDFDDTGNETGAAGIVGRPVVLGQSLAQQVGVGVGDEVVVFFEAADGSLGNDLLEIVGLLKTGDSTIDRQSAYLRLEDLQFTAALEEHITEIALRVDPVTDAPEVAEGVSRFIGSLTGGAGDKGTDRSMVQDGAPQELVARPWQDIIPSIAQLLEVSAKSNYFLYVIVYLLVALGLLNSQRMSALERHREFGVLLAIGVSPNRLFWVVMAETLLLALFGAMIGAVMGTSLSLYHAIYGLDLSMLGSDAGYSVMGVSFSDRFYYHVTPRTVLEPLSFVLPVALLCGLWPALHSARIDITSAISGRL